MIGNIFVPSVSFLLPRCANDSVSALHLGHKAHDAQQQQYGSKVPAPGFFSRIFGRKDQDQEKCQQPTVHDNASRLKSGFILAKRRAEINASSVGVFALECLTRIGDELIMQAG